MNTTGSSIRDPLSAQVEALSGRETALAAQAAEIADRLSGLKDLDVLLPLAEVRLEWCLTMMRWLARGDAPEDARDGITERSLSAFSIIDGLMTENISEDQREAFSKDPRFSPVKEKLQEFILAGGGDFLESRKIDGDKQRHLARSIVASIRKYIGNDDTYPPLEVEEYPASIRKILLILFPAFVREHPQKPPYGIEEGEEVEYSSQKMKLPVSQAILYLEEEMLPEMRKKLEESPGDRELQDEIRGVERTAEEYKRMRFFPRSVPVLLEQGYYTEGFTSYTDAGEMLVPIPLTVRFKSGTNLDRRMELVRMDLVKRIAGTGISPELDKEYKRLQSMESGIRGSSRTPGFRLDTVWGFAALKTEFPSIARLEDKEGFKELLKIAAGGSASESARRVAALLRADESAGGNARRIT